MYVFVRGCNSSFIPYDSYKKWFSLIEGSTYSRVELSILIFFVLMIAISSRLDDFATSRVIDWLYFWGKNYFRFNGDCHDIHFKYSNGKLSARSIYCARDIDISEITSFWYRKCGINRSVSPDIAHVDLPHDKCEAYKIDHYKEYLKTEFLVYRAFIFEQIQKQASFKLCEYEKRELNKLSVLVIARNIGLKTPATYIINKKSELKDLIKQKGDMIVKPMHEGVYDVQKSRAYVSYTSLVTEADLSSIPDTFPHSLFQEKIEKRFELRVIYIAGRCYAVALFTQELEGATIDGRRCQPKDLRIVPYRLPDSIAQKLSHLMRLLDLQFGAIDLVVDSNGAYVFLEVNPVGQFTAYGTACNYYLEKELASLL